MIKFLEMREKFNNANYAALCLFGNDEWVKAKALANVMDFLDVVDDGFSVHRLQNPTVEEMRFACFTPTMFGNKKVVVCEGYALPDGAKLKTAQQQIAQLLAQWDGSFCLVFVADSDKGFADIAGVETVNCNRLDKAKVISWITTYGRRNGVVIDNLCADKIASYCLCDMARVSVETKKLVDYGNVTAESIDMLVFKDAEYVVYDLSGTIADRNATKALTMFNGLVARGEEPRALFALLYNYYRRVYYVKTSGFSTEELASYLGVKPGAVGFAKETANRYKPMQLKRALDCFFVADQRLKAFVDEKDVLQMLIMQLVAL